MAPAALSRWPRDAQSANLQVSIPYDGVGYAKRIDLLIFLVKFGTVIQHRVG